MQGTPISLEHVISDQSPPSPPLPSRRTLRTSASPPPPSPTSHSPNSSSPSIAVPLPMAPTFASSSPIIKLNVGGKIFQTSLSTLTRLKPTFFSAMFSGKYSLNPDSDSGSYFIDRDPVVFRHVLNYLRGDLGVHMEYLSVYELSVLRADAVYYGLEGLSEMVTEKEVEMERKRERRKSGEAIDRYTWDSKNCPGHFVISNGGKRVSSTNSTAGLITTNVRIRPKKVTEIKIHILKEPNWTYLGVATKSCLTSGVHPQTHPAGWFFKSHHSANFIELYHDGVKLAEVVGYNFGEGETIKLRVNEHMALSIATDGKPEVHSYPLSKVDGLYFALAMAYRGHELEITDKGS